MNNLRLNFGEVDLLFISPEEELTLVEVKSVRSDDISFRPLIGPDQRRRLKRVFESLCSTSKRPVRIHLAAVNQQGKIFVYHDFLSDEV